MHSLSSILRKNHHEWRSRVTARVMSSAAITNYVVSMVMDVGRAMSATLADSRRW